MKKYYPFGAAVFLFILLAVVVFRCAFGADNAFSASDANIGLLTANRPHLAELFEPGYGGYILGLVRPPRFSPYELLHALLPPLLFNDLIAPLYLVLSSILLLVFLRMWGRSWTAAVLGGITAFWLGSSTMAGSGHYGKLGVALFAVATLILIEKSVRSTGFCRLCWAILAGTSVGFMLLSQQDVGLLFGLMIAPYALFRLVQLLWRKPDEWIVVLLPILLIGLLLSAGKAISSYQTSIRQASVLQGSGRDKWNFITQWSYPPQEFPDLLAPGFMGWRTNDPKAPYWGVSGQSADWDEGTGRGYRNFRLDSVYLGLVSVILALTALISVFRKEGSDREAASMRAAIIFWGILGTVMLFLAFGKFTPIYRLVIHLPLIGDIRGPAKFLQIFAIILGILAAFGLDAVITDKMLRKKAVIVAAVFSGCFLLTSLVLIVGRAFITQHFAQWGSAAVLIVRRMQNSALYAMFSAGIAALILKYAVNAERCRIVGVLFCFMLVVDSVWLTSHYFRADDVGAMKQGNAVITFLKEHQGDQRVFTFDRGGIYNQWIGVDFPLHGINGFWFWQAPRLSQEYKKYLSFGSKNLVALLQSTSVRYALAPASLVQKLPKDIFKPVLFYRFGLDQQKNLVVQPLASPQDARDQVILELTQTLPRVSLFYNWKRVSAEEMNEVLFEKSSNVMEKVLIDAALPAPKGTGFDPVESIEWKHNSVKVIAKAKEDAVVLFTQRFQPQWKAFVDGEPTSVFRCNSLSMGVYVPAGNHEVIFKCSGYRVGTILQLAGLGISLAALLYLVYVHMGAKSGSAVAE